MTPMLLPPDDPRAPKYWAQESSGVLKPVILAYLRGDQLDADSIGIMRGYLHQWAQSPVWMPSGALAALRLQVMAIATNAGIRAAINAMAALGMDPL